MWIEQVLLVNILVKNRPCNDGITGCRSTDPSVIPAIISFYTYTPHRRNSIILLVQKLCFHKMYVQYSFIYIRFVHRLLVHSGHQVCSMPECRSNVLPGIRVCTLRVTYLGIEMEIYCSYLFVWIRSSNSFIHIRVNTGTSDHE